MTRCPDPTSPARLLSLLAAAAALPLALAACAGGERADIEVQEVDAAEGDALPAEGTETEAPDPDGSDLTSAGSEDAGGGTSVVLESEPLGWEQMSEADWKERLSPEAFRVLRKAGTERAFTGEYWDEKRAGTFTCAGCDLPLFSSETKYKSGTGWPSFWQPLDEASVGRDTDHKLGYARTEVHCARCGGHLGHVFNDGPQPTGLRYCINSVSLDFQPNEASQEG